MSAIIYCRTSSANQEDSLITQEKLCRTYCVDNNLNISQVYLDNGISGKDLKRPGITKLLSELSQNSVLVTTEISRLSRDAKDLEEIKSKLDSLSIKLITLHTLIDYDTDIGRIEFEKLAITSQYERELISKRVIAGMAQAKAEGRLVTHAHYGFKIVGKKEVINDKEQEIMDLVKKLLSEQPKIKYEAIVNILNEKGYRNRHNNLFTNGSVRNIAIKTGLRK